MALYLSEITISSSTMATLIQNPQNRAEAVRPMFEAVGGRLHEYYVAVGSNTVYITGDVPDQASLVAIATAALASGSITSIKSTPIVTAEDAVEMFRKAGSVGYRPPST